MKEQTALISYDEIEKAYKRWFKMLKPNPDRNGRIHPQWADFLGVKNSFKQADNTQDKYEIEVEAVNKIRQLNGPHWQTLLKAHMARKQDEDTK